MNWKDTVMSDEGILGVYSESFPHTATVEFIDREIAKHQAELTWDTAFKAGMLEESTQAYSAGNYAGKKLGIQEVVEILRKTGWDRAADDVEISLGIKEEL